MMPLPRPPPFSDAMAGCAICYTPVGDGHVVGGLCGRRAAANALTLQEALEAVRLLDVGGADVMMRATCVTRPVNGGGRRYRAGVHEI